MDPVSLTSGAVSLSFQVFAGCIQAYQLISEAKGWRTEYQYLRVRLKTEQCRFLDWAHVANLTEREEALLISRASRGVLVDILDQQRRLLLKFGRLDDWLQPLANPLLSDDTDDQRFISQGVQESFGTRFPQAGTLLRSSLEFVRKTTRLSSGLRWVMSDKTKVEELIAKLSALNDFLKELLNEHQLERLKSRNLRTDYQLMQLNQRVDYLEEIVASCSMASPDIRIVAATNETHLSAAYSTIGGGFSNHNFRTDSHQLKDPNLVHLAQFKALNSSFGSQVGEDSQSLDLQYPEKDINSIESSLRNITIIGSIPSNDQYDQRTEAWYKRPNGSFQLVWIEWKELSNQVLNSKTDLQNSSTLRRFKALVVLLKENRITGQFKAPHCLGYFIQRAENSRVGLVFEYPPNSEQQPKLLSLLQLIQNKKHAVPSFTTRIALAKAIAECLEKLHAVNWLHKGIRSDNIIFFQDEQPAPDLSKPFFSGFDYSRPANHENMTEKPPENPAHDLYRHPQAQGQARDDPDGGPFKKLYYIYSLGIVLMEIVYWKPINVIVGIRDLQNAKPSEVVKLRGRLLDEGFLDDLQSRLGDTIPAIIESCLEGPTAFGIPKGADETNPFIGARLQAQFYDIVVKRLQGIKI